MDRLVITGMGAVTPVGTGVYNYWKGLLSGKTGINYINRSGIEELPVRFAGQVHDFEPKDHMPGKLAGQMGRFMQMAFAAAKEAVESAGGITEPYRTGITVGTALNGFSTIAETERDYNRSPFRKVTPRFMPKALGNVCASQIAIAHDIHGPSMTVNTACASGGDAITLAATMILAGMADTMVVVGAESALDSILIQSLAAAKALSPYNENPGKACRPFDENRSGFVLGEGAGALVIEREDHAKARNARMFATLAGWGNNTDAYHPVTPRPDGEGEILCMKQAMKVAGIEPEQIGYVNAHGTATVKGDICESEAIEAVFGGQSGTADVAVSSTKAATGHMMGAGGITEVIACIRSVETGIIPATLNLENQDPLCRINCVRETAKAENLEYAMSNAFGFGGQNSSIIVGKL